MSGRMWLMADYLPEVAALDQIFPLPEQIAGWLGGRVQVDVLPIPRDCTDRALRGLSELDVGLRLITARPSG